MNADICRVCLNRVATQTHHRKMRSQGGGDEPRNLLRVCTECHGRIHANPEWAYERGYLVKSWDVVGPMQQTVDGREEPWQAHTHEDGVEECGRCHGTGKVKVKPPKEEQQAPERKKVVKAIRVPKDEHEDGYEILDSLIEQATELLKTAELLKSVNRGAEYYALVYVLTFFVQNFKPETERAS